MKTWTLLLTVVLTIAAPHGVARADFAYRFVAGTTEVVVDPGAQFVVEVYLEETVSGGDSSRLLGTGNGLVTAGVRVEFGVGAPAAVLAESDILPNAAGFTETLDPLFLRDLPGDGTAGLLQAVALGDEPVGGVEVSPGVVRVSLGGFRFTALSPGELTVTLGDFDALTNTTVLTGMDALNLDGLIASSTVSIRVVPEPSGLLLLSLGGLALVPVFGRSCRGRSR